MRKGIYFFMLIVLAFCWTCANETQNSLNSSSADNPWNNDRPHDPWVFRSVLDNQARMLTVALHDDLWVAYNTGECSLYKAWKGSVDFDGAVYTSSHGPQPLSVGDAYFINVHKSPWMLIENGKEEPIQLQYKGHVFENGQVSINYAFYNGQSKPILINEAVEYSGTDNGLATFKRTFTTQNLAEGQQLALRTNLNSVVNKNQIISDGEFEIINESTKTKGDFQALEIDAKLILNSNASTTLEVTFGKEPFIDNPNKKEGEEVKSNLPKGYKLIARSDCKTCHNTHLKTIGPAYMDVAKKYPNNEASVNMLAAKVKAGGSGVWGNQVMNAHPNESMDDLKEMVKYIMELDAEEEALLANTVVDEIDENMQVLEAQKEVDMVDYFPGAILEVIQYAEDIKQLKDMEKKGQTVFVGTTAPIRAEGADFGGLENNFGIKARGYLNIPATGKYTFRLVSDDGSNLIIDGQEIINHDGLHGADPKTGAVALEEGIHPFAIDFFQGYGGKMISFEYKVGAGYQVVPGTMIVHNRKELPEGTRSGPIAGTQTKIPGDAASLTEVHPSYTLTQARPDDFIPKVGGMDFLSNGKLVVSTWDPNGSVYLLDGVQSGDPDKITAKLIAKGFAEPLGVKVVDDVIYVLQKQELTRLKDLNGDEIIDEYETVSNAWQVSSNFHEFAFGLVYKDGYFYATLATAINPGGASTKPQIPDRGKAVKISIEDGSTEFIAHGLRTPNGIGIGVDDEIFVADNQGDWLPASKIVHIQKGAWYGSRSVDFEGTAKLTETKPVVWLPQDEIGNSPSTPMIINDGPYKGQMIHGEVTHGGVKRVFVEKVNGAYQGALFRFTQGLEAGVNRIVWGPDGALYVGGIGNPGNWGHSGKLWYGLQRMKYNGNSTFEMLAVRAKSNGVEIEFTEPLQEGHGWEKSGYEIKQWYYLPTENYGGPKLDERNLNIRTVNVSDDRKKVFLELDGMKEDHVVYIRILNSPVSDLGHELWTSECWYTLNNIPANQNGFKTQQTTTLALNTLTASEKANGWELLFDGKTTSGWRNFKKEGIGSSWKVVDGTLMLDSERNAEGNWQAKDGGDIITEEQYENFELSLEWKINQCGNSGIMFNVVESDEYEFVWQTGPEMQVLDNTCHPDSKIHTHRAGDLYDMIACKYETVLPSGQWNKVRLIVNNGKAEHWLNGRKLVEYEMFNEDWKAMIAKSKFKDMPGFGKSRSGHISLQDHSDPVWYRNIKIRKLDPST